jgi:hypothetical protein
MREMYRWEAVIKQLLQRAAVKIAYDITLAKEKAEQKRCGKQGL